jgi:WD40 repeat protein
MGIKAWEFTIHEADTGKLRVTSSEDFGYSWAFAFNSDGTRIATAGEDGLTRLWDTATGKLIAQCRGHTLKVLSVAFRPDGRRLATTSADGTVRQWDPETGLEVESPYVRHTGEIITAAYSPDGQWIASSGTDRTIRVWLAADLRDVAVLNGHTGVVSQLAFTADGRQLASVSQSERDGDTGDGTVRVWDVGPQAATPVLRGHTSYVYPVAYSADGQWIASGCWDKTVRVWDAVTGESCAILPHVEGVHALAFSPDSTWLVAGMNSKSSLNFWDVATARLKKEIKRPGLDGIQAVAVSPDGNRIAAASFGSSASLLDAVTGTELRPFEAGGPVGAKKPLVYSPDGRLLVGTGEDGKQIEIWETRTQQLVAELKGHSGLVYSLAFSRDGLLLASASADHTVRVWDMAGAKSVAVLTGHTDQIFSAVFHPDGKRLASAGRDRAIWLWDLSTGQEVARLDGHTNYVFSLAFSPDGSTLVSGSGDGTVRLWDTQPLARRHRARREAEALRPEAERLVAGLFAELREPDEVVARLKSDQSLSEPLRRATLRAVMRRGRQTSRRRNASETRVQDLDSASCPLVLHAVPGRQSRLGLLIDFSSSAPHALNLGSLCGQDVGIETRHHAIELLLSR